MGSTAKRKCISKGGLNCAPLDRFSDLPDLIISHILSFLPTDRAVRTTILSKRLRYLWTSITNVDFDDRIDWSTYLQLARVGGYLERSNEFMHFVYHVLAMLDSSRIHKFVLNCCHHKSSYVNTCVNAASRRDVEELYVSIKYGEEPMMKFPGSILSWKTLVVLKLSGFSITVSGALSYAVAFPKLMTLYLLNVDYEDDDSLPKFLSSCPVLKNLIIENIHQRNTTSVISCSIVNLKIKNYSITDADFCHLKINAPALQCLDLSDRVSDKFSFENLWSLVTAHIDVDPPNKSELPRPVLCVLKAMSNVRNLKLSYSTMKVLCDDSNLGFKFSNLKKLEVTVSKDLCFELCGLLRSVDIEKLSDLKTNRTYDDDDFSE